MQLDSEIIDKLQPILVNAGRAELNGDWNWKNVNSPFMRIYYVESGRAAVCMRGRSWPLQPAHLYMIPAFVTHSYECDSPFCHYYFHIYFDNSRGETVSELFDFPFEVTAEDNDHALARRLCALNPELSLAHTNPKTYDNDDTLHSNIRRSHGIPLAPKVESRGIIFQLLSRFIAGATPRHACNDHRITDVINYIRTHFSDDFDMSVLANVARLSPDHLTRLFKKETGESPMGYAVRLRISRACQLLLTEPEPVKSIAYSLGFNDHSYFNRVFKKHTGMSPQEYRQVNIQII